MNTEQSPSLRGACHCGAVQLRLPSRPELATQCNCSLCRRIGGPWVYFPFGSVEIAGHPEHTTDYVQGDRTLRTVRCRTCGCVTHWEPIDGQPGARHGVHLGNFDPAVIASVRVRRFDGADTWTYLDEAPAAETSPHPGAAPMHDEIYVNLPVNDLPASKAFWQALGYGFNEQFSDEKAACLVLGPSIRAMLLTKPFFAGFCGRPIVDAKAATEVLNCLKCSSREQLDGLVAAAVANGGSAPRPLVDHGFMVQHGFEDLDGHIWELVHFPAP